MKALKITTGNRVYISFLLVATFVLFVSANVSVASDKPVATPCDQLVWVEIAPFLQMSEVAGNMGVGEHGTVGKFTPNSDTPPHTHSGAYHGVVISGVMANPFGDEKNPQS